MVENNKNIQLNNIEASLRYGIARLPKEVFVILLVSVIICVVSGVACLFVAIAYKESAAIVMIFVFIAIALICVIVFLYFYWRKTKVRLWLKDAMLLKAKCSTLGKQPEEKEISDGAKAAFFLATTATGVPEGYHDNRFPNPRILVTFKYNGKVIKRMSGKQGYGEEEIETGRNPIFKKYIGKEIDILYSPKYDEVLLLKLKNGM